MNYLFSRIECESTFKQNTAERRAFAKHLQLVTKALHDIEWVDSGDYAPGDESEAIRACLSGSEVLSAAKECARSALEELTRELERADLFGDI